MLKYAAVVLVLMQGVPSQAKWWTMRGRGRGRGGRGRGGGGAQQETPATTAIVDTTTTPAVVEGTTTTTNVALGPSDDNTIIQHLVQNRDKIQRTVEFTDDGVTSRTWSDDDTVSSWLEQHVAAMQARLETGNRIRQRDPLFRAVFDHADEFDGDLLLDFVAADGGVYVTETSSTRCGIDLIQAHAQVVTAFIDKGPAEVRLNHAVPDTCA